MRLRQDGVRVLALLGVLGFVPACDDDEGCANGTPSCAYFKEKTCTCEWRVAGTDSAAAKTP